MISVNPSSMLNTQWCAQFESLWVHRQTPQLHHRGMEYIHMARTGQAIAIMMNNKLKQWEAGVGEDGLSDVNLLINNVGLKLLIYEETDVRSLTLIRKAAHRPLQTQSGMI